jgi:hypothetical protein
MEYIIYGGLAKVPPSSQLWVCSVPSFSAVRSPTQTSAMLAFHIAMQVSIVIA